MLWIVRLRGPCECAVTECSTPSYGVPEGCGESRTPWAAGLGSSAGNTQGHCVFREGLGRPLS